MRYPAAEKLEIIRLVEQSHLPVRRVLEQIGIPIHVLSMVRSLSGRANQVVSSPDTWVTDRT